jgi:RNA polymerase primary sigma factor
MRTTRDSGDVDGFAPLDSMTSRVLPAQEERQLLRELAQCKKKLADALAKIPGASLPDSPDAPQALAKFIEQAYTQNDGAGARLGAVYHRYNELRSKLALANMRLVAHVAKRFRDRGVAYSDLLQEGFCGLLEAIDRFDLNHETKLATYATWWIRQAMQRVVAGCAYPVRLSPRHLRQLAQNQEELDRQPRVEGDAGPSTEMIQRIHVATRPTVSLNASLDSDSNFNLLQTMSDPDGDRTDDVDTEETVTRLMSGLRPREQQVLALRFGLGGKPRLSLSQVGKVMEVSKERVRQIQDRALEKMRVIASEHDLVGMAVLNA